MKHHISNRLRAGCTALAAGLLLSVARVPAARAADTATPVQRGVKLSLVSVKAPAVKMVRADGKPVLFTELLADSRPVMLNFVFTSCSAICPIQSQAFSEVQQQLGADAARVQFVSVSIDPEHDTPDALRAYARQYAAGPQWVFLTGSEAGSDAIQKAFNAFRGDKMNHEPLTMLRGRDGDKWTAVEGLAGPKVLVPEVRRLLAAR